MSLDKTGTAIMSRLMAVALDSMGAAVSTLPLRPAMASVLACTGRYELFFCLLFCSEGDIERKVNILKRQEILFKESSNVLQ